MALFFFVQELVEFVGQRNYFLRIADWAKESEMADSAKRARLVAEMSLLRKQQLESIENAAFFGWTPEAKADHDKRADRMELLLSRLAELDETPRNFPAS